MTPKKIAVLGGGNGAHTMAAEMTLKGHTVTLYEMPKFRQNMKEVFETKTINLKGNIPELQGPVTLNMVTDDLAKAGQFYLQKGRRNGKQLLSEKWIDEASAKHTVMEYKLDTPLDTNRGYGYQIWRCKPEGSYRMDGAHGQFVIILPEQNAVIVITGHCSQTQKELDAVWQHILPTL